MASAMEARGPAPAKSAAAFRTISEVSAELDVPQHVLRFWETKFPQIRPLKRGGGRRYYRPDDVVLLRRIQTLLYKEGYTIKGVQRLLKESRGTLADLPEDGEAPLGDSAEEADVIGLEPPPEGGISPDVRRELRQILDELILIRQQLKG
jgi:DNA-binding transcriptional MerR regulator